MTDDAELLSRYAEERSQAAFAEIVERHLGMVYHAAVRQLGGDAHRANDVAQAVFIMLAEKANQLRGHPSLAGWLHTATRLTAANMVREIARRRSREEAAHSMSENQQTSAHDEEWMKLRPVIDDVLAELATEDREAVLLRFFEGKSFAEIGERLRLSEGSAHKRVERALEKTRGRLTKRGIFSVTALAGALGTQAGLAAPVGLSASVMTAASTATIAPAAVSLVATLTFMATTKIMMGTAALVVAGTAFVFVSEQRAERVARGAMAYANGQTAEWDARLKAERLRCEEADKKRRELEARHTAELRAVQDKEWAAMNARTGVQDGAELLKRYPELRDSVVSVSRTLERNQWEPLFRELGLSNEQIERFLDLELANSRRVVGKHMFELFPSVESDRQIKENLKALLGENGYKLYRDFEKTGPARNFTNELASTLYYTASPLTEGQSKDIGQIVRKHYSGRAWGWVSADGWTELKAYAERSLPPEQRAEIERMHADWLFYEKQKVVTQAYEEAVKAGGVAP